MTQMRGGDPLARLVDEAALEPTEEVVPRSGTADRTSPTSTASADSSATESSPGLDVLDSAIERAQEYAERWAAPYRQEVFRIAVAHLLGAVGAGSGGRTLNDQTSEPEHSPGRWRKPLPPSGLVADETGPTGLALLDKLAHALGVESTALERVVQISPDGVIALLGRLPGKSTRELQTRYSLVYLYVKEVALGVRLVDVEELRNLCIAEGCYDLSNFAGNFRKDVDAGLLRGSGEKGARSRRYMLSQTGLAESAALIRQMVEQ